VVVQLKAESEGMAKNRNIGMSAMKCVSDMIGARKETCDHLDRFFLVYLRLDGWTYHQALYSFRE
jgi:hypothetical protein